MTTAKPHGICSMLLAWAGLAAGAAAAQGTAAAAQGTAAAAQGTAAAAQGTDSGGTPLGRQSFLDAGGVITTLSVNGPIDSHGAFFQSLGTNGRSCATCHVASQAMSISAAGVQRRFVETRGSDPLFAPLDIGTGHSLLPGAETDANIAAGLGELSMPNLPVYLISGCPDPFNAGQPESFYTTDPGKALISGLCSDFNRGKGPILRGLAARAPYFHNGAAADLDELVNFYDKRFQMNLTGEQKRQLVAFLNSL